MSRTPPDATTSSATILVRLSVGAVFLSEGIQKFLFPADVGAGRFERIGIPAPEILGSLFLAWVGGGRWSLDRLRVLPGPEAVSPDRLRPHAETPSPRSARR